MKIFGTSGDFICQQATRHHDREEESSNCSVGSWRCSLAGFSSWWSKELKREGGVALPNGAAVYWKVGG